MPKPIVALSKNPVISPLTGSGNAASKKAIAFDPGKYKAFGSEATDAYNEGWTPQEFINSTKRVYTNPYDNALSQVVINGDSRLGHLALVGNDNGYFDVALRNADGVIIQNLLQKAPYSVAKQYITNQVKGRVDNIQSGKVASVKGDVVALK